MKIKLTTQHKWLLILLAIILVNAVVWVYGLAPALGSVDAARAELNQAQHRKDSKQKQLDQLNAIDTDVLLEQWEEIRPQIPEQGMLREFISGLVDLADEMGMPLPSVSISMPAQVNPYFSVTLSTSFVGSYEQIKSFLIALEQHERLILVRIISFTGAEESLNCSLSISIFAENFDHLTPYKAPGRDSPFKEK